MIYTGFVIAAHDGTHSRRSEHRLPEDHTQCPANCHFPTVVSMAEGTIGGPDMVDPLDPRNNDPRNNDPRTTTDPRLSAPSGMPPPPPARGGSGYLLGAVLLAAIVILAYFFYRNGSGTDTAAPPSPPPATQSEPATPAPAPPASPPAQN
ncbi:Hypothetical protein OINT_1002352 [Brucella intermedia LMG 3301]|uniref:Uncharacterized protein n=2 Tax=Brucella/Ochrobactrum group TaxID=2826938 RepID=C4WJX0_9HYPH|nr:Hypothetical protein OINT_1002352 [Brucella intermedia LMG 3301]